MTKPSSSSALCMRMIKVAHVASGDLWAGAEVQLFTLVVQLQQLPNISVHVCLLNHGLLHQKLIDAGISVSVFDESKLGTLSIGANLYRTLRQFKPDVIHTHRLKENILGSVAALLLKNTVSIRTVHGAREHPPGILEPRKRLLYFIDFLCARYLQKKVIAVSEELAEQLSTSLPSKKVSVVFNGIDSEAVQSQANTQISSIGRKEAGTKICFAGRLARVKRLDIWLEAASILINESDYYFNFYIIGDGPEKRQISALAEKLQIAEYIQFLGERQDVPSLLKQMDILLLTSDHEGLPMVILEALCVKTLVIAHDVGGIGTLLDHGKAGYLVADHKGKHYAQAVLQSLRHPSEAIEKMRYGFRRASSVYTAKVCAKRYAAEYLELL